MIDDTTEQTPTKTSGVSRGLTSETLAMQTGREWPPESLAAFFALGDSIVVSGLPARAPEKMLGALFTEADKYREAVVLTKPSGGQEFFVPCADERSGFRRLTAENTRSLIAQGMARALVGKQVRVNSVTPAEWLKTSISWRADVDYAGPVPGWPAGRYAPGVVSSGAAMVTNGPTFVEPVKGDWTFIEEIMNKVLGFEPGLRQKERFFAWLQRAIQRLRDPGGPLSLQALFVVGGVGTYKSFIQATVLEPLLGGRSADFFGILQDGNRFNSDIFESALLCASDPWKNNGKELQRALTSFLKGVSGERWHREEGKNRKAGSLRPVWACVLLGNETSQALAAIPDVFQADSKDKLLGLRTPPDGGVTLSMPMSTAGGKKACAARVAAELPAFAWFLEKEFQLDADLADERWGIRGWVHPGIGQLQADRSDAQELLTVLDFVLFSAEEAAGSFLKLSPANSWCGGASQLKSVLAQSSSAHRGAVKFVNMSLARFGGLLGEACEAFPERVTKMSGRPRIGGRRASTTYEILPPDRGEHQELAA